MLDELDNAAKELNISQQAVIKTLIRQASIIWQAASLLLRSGRSDIVFNGIAAALDPLAREMGLDINFRFKRAVHRALHSHFQ